MASGSTLDLRTPRLALRRPTAGDARLLFELDGDPRVMEHISKGEPTPLARIENEVLPAWLACCDEHAPLGYWLAHDGASGSFVGWFHFRPDRQEPDAVELGYRLNRRSWGQGLATEGGRALVARGFDDWRVERVVASTLVGNLGSRRVLEKCGLRPQGEHVYGADLLHGWSAEERRAVRYALNASEFPRARAAWT